jgi:hypothetical protein
MSTRSALSAPSYWANECDGPDVKFIYALFLPLLAAGLIPTLGTAAAESSQATHRIDPARRPVLCYVETLFGGASAADLDFRACTHVIEAFVLVDSSGALRPANGLPRQAISAAARRAGARVLVSVGGASVPGAAFSAIARDRSKLDNFAQAIAEFVARAGYDGIDLDWEFPTPIESPLHLALVRALKAALASRLAATGGAPIVTVPVGAYWIPAYNLDALQDEVDFIILMGYDFRNPALGPWAHDSALWPVDARAPIEGSVRGAASAMIRQGLPHRKLIVAFPFYTGAYQPWVEVRERALASASPLHPLFLEKLIDETWITDPVALERKIRAALFGSEIGRGNAAGIAVWQLGHQGKSRDLSDAIRRAMSRTPGD